VTAAACVQGASAPSTGTPVAALARYRLSASLVHVSSERVTLRARLVRSVGRPPPARLEVWLPAHGASSRRLVATVTLMAARRRTFTVRVTLRVGERIVVSVVANERAGLTALHATLVATRRLGAR
jgi:hypothetical protein